MSTYPKLLSPIDLGLDLKLANRVVMAPMTRGRATDKLKANDVMAEYYAQRASAGLIITEGTHISVLGRGWFQAPDIFTEEDAKAWKLVADRVHSHDGKIFCQLWHTGRASHSSFREGVPGYEGDMKLSVAPSAIKRGSHSGKQGFTKLPGQVDIETPRALTTEEVDALPEEYRNAAQQAKDAGFDGVEIHSANGYLLDEFLQSCSNKRTDKYGGSMENRFRLLDDVIRAVLTVFEPHQVGVRFSPNGVFNGMGSDDYRESFLYYAQRVAEYKLGYLHIMIGLGFGFHNKGEPMTMAEFRKVYPGTLMANVGYDAKSAEEEIASGNTDMVSFGRPFISNPDFVERLASGAKLNDPAPQSVYYSSVENAMAADGYTDFPTMS
uniref:NADH oxidase n=1 Tax=Gracilariopsis lemaneiformis TaxID=2782 RepID=A0A3Q8HZL0_GRALE|nr:NADH oxidase [Gracilariopsis lemaneiformis]